MGLLQPPPWPGWDGFHPLVIHFPIALLLIAPLFVFIAAILPKRGVAFAYAALVLLVAGTISLFVAVESGEAAGQLVEDAPGVAAVLERHEHLAEITRTVFATLTVIYALALTARWWFTKLQAARATVCIHGVMLVMLAVAGLILANTAHQGGRLVHELGVRSMMAPSGPVTDASQ